MITEDLQKKFATLAEKTGVALYARTYNFAPELNDLMIQFIAYAKKELIKEATKWWQEEFEYPTMTEEEKDWYRDKVKEFKEHIEES